MVTTSTPQKTHRQTRDVVGSIDSFAKLGLPDGYRRALLLAGYRRPSPVQEKAIPYVRLGSDLIVQAKSGTGKTLVFALACVERVNAGAWHPQALIISPTREIAQQNSKEIQRIANNLPYPNLSSPVFTGGVSIHEDRRRLMRPAQVIVGTPGRLLCLIQHNLLNLDGIRLLVLDEADQLFNSESLKSTLETILTALPSARQSLAFSATYSTEAMSSIESWMDYPQLVVIPDCQEPLIGVKQCFKLIRSEANEEPGVIFERKLNTLLKLFDQVSFNQAVVFCNSKSNAELIKEKLNSLGIQSAVTSGKKSQTHRIQTINAMREFEIRVVISTDLYARGVNLERVNLVVNLDLPFDKETYQHRVGRTGRFGTHGLSIALVTEFERVRLEQYCGIDTITTTKSVEGSLSNVLIPLPEGEAIPMEWYEQKLIKKSDQVAYEKLMETPCTPEVLRHFENENENWLGQISQSDFNLWKNSIEKRSEFWRHWDPYHQTSKSSGLKQTEVQLQETRDWISKSPSELSLRSGGSSSRRSNCIRLPVRLSRTASTSSTVYSEEGDCEFEDDSYNFELKNDTDQNSISDQVDSDEVEAFHETSSHSANVALPNFPTEMNSFADFEKLKDAYEKWREEYMKWHQNYNHWFDIVKQKMVDSDLPLPPLPLNSRI
eukprot:g1328.t1